MYEMTSFGRTFLPRAISRRATCAGGMLSLLGYSSGRFESFYGIIVSTVGLALPEIFTYRVNNIFLRRNGKLLHLLSEFAQVVMDLVEDNLLILAGQDLVQKSRRNFLGKRTVF